MTRAATSWRKITGHFAKPSTSGNRLDHRASLVSWVLVLGALTVVLDTTITNVAIGSLAQAMHAPLPVIQWVMTGYTLALATVMPVSAWAIGRLGGKRVYLLALSLFLAGSVAAGLAWNVTSLIGFRVLQGLGGGMVIPTVMTLAFRAAPPNQRGRIMAILSVPILIGPVAGPLLGGWLLDALSWHWIFFINVPIGILAIVLAARLLRSEPADPTHRLDLPGLLLLSPGLAALIYGLATAASAGTLISAQSLIPTLAGAALVAAFIVRATRVRQALLDLRLLRFRSMAVGAVVITLFAAAFFGSMFLVPMYYQVVRGENAFVSGLLMLPEAVATGVVAQIANRLIDRVSARRVIGTGIAMAIIGFSGFALSMIAASAYGIQLLALAVAGAGVGASLSPTITTATRWLSDEQMPSGTTLLNVTQQTATSFGTAATSVLLGIGLTSRFPRLLQSGVGDLYQLPARTVHAIAPRLAGAFGVALLLVIGLMVLALVATVTGLPRARPRARQ